MCQMYAIFEEVIGPQPGGTFKGTSPTDDEDQGVEADTPATTPHDAPSATDLYAPKRPPQRLYGPSSLYQSRYASTTLPRANGRRRLDDLDDSESVCSSNPLLDTISVLTYDPPDDADDYYDLGEEDESDSSKPGKSGDRDSVGYAGSSSIDSGYKSFCPTPEIPDQYYDRANKPNRIVMGTKVIGSRQGHVSPLRESPGSSRRSDSSLYDVNLDHLMYLRQSLLSAIQKCEKSSEVTTSTRTDPPDPPSDPVPDEHYLDRCPPSRSSSVAYTKTVRFNTDLEGGKEQQSASDSKVQKSILKDPLCANLRSQLEAGAAADCTLEEEIDSLLYGRAEFYDLESVDDFPCSYVTMIEEKYRSGKPSIAKVRKLKGEKSTEQLATKPSTSPDTPSTTTTPPAEPPSPPQPPDDTRQSSSTSKPPTVSISKTAKCRFTEVARCMLEIIEDLQLKKEAEKTDGGSPPAALPKAPEPPAAADSYAAAAEYHVYEEIDYDFLTPRVPEVPPPLPARPTGMKPVARKRLPSPPTSRKPRCPQRRAEGPATEVRNRPKQRGNLYCLFADRVERRNISRSLEREWRDNGSSDNHEDDYGFKKDFPSI